MRGFNMSDAMWSTLRNETLYVYGVELSPKYDLACHATERFRCRTQPPPDMSFTLPILFIVVVYCVLFLTSVAGNGIMFFILVRNQMIKRRRVHTLLLHMNIAHLIVTFFYMPKEILHNYMIAWNGGDALCRICKFLDVFGNSLSANLLCVVSLDRFYSIFYPLYAIKAQKTVNHMVALAWVSSFVGSIPQIFFFKTSAHPCHRWFSQCVAKNFIKEMSDGTIYWYSVFNIVQVYLLPLLITLSCYLMILLKISHKNCSRTEVGKNSLLRRNGGDNLQRARSRTFKMTLAVVVSFFICWTPYATVMFLHFTTNNEMIPKEGRKLLYAFAVFNSALTPYVYGMFMFDIKKELKLLFACSTRNVVSERIVSHSSTIHHSARQGSRMRKRSQSANNIPNEHTSLLAEQPAALRVHSLRLPKKSLTNEEASAPLLAIPPY